MKKILKFLSAGFLILTFPVTVLGASYESEEGQAMIGPPSSQTEDGSEAFSDSPAEGTPSGIDWDAANTAASPASGSGDFTVVIDPGHQGPSVDMSLWLPVPVKPRQKQPPAHRETSPAFRNMRSTCRFPFFYSRSLLTGAIELL